MGTRLDHQPLFRKKTPGSRSNSRDRRKSNLNSEMREVRNVVCYFECTLRDTFKANKELFPVINTLSETKILDFSSKRDDEHRRPFRMGVSFSLEVKQLLIQRISSLKNK